MIHIPPLLLNSRGHTMPAQMPVPRILAAPVATNYNSQQWNFLRHAEECQLEQLAAQYRCIIYDRIRMDNGVVVYMKCQLANFLQCPFRMRYNGPTGSLYSQCKHNHPQTSPIWGMPMLPISSSHPQQQQQPQQPTTKRADNQKQQNKKKEKAKNGRERIPGWRFLQTVKDENELRGMFAGRQLHWHLGGKKRKRLVLRCQQWPKCRYQLGWFMERQELSESGQHNHPIEKEGGGEDKAKGKRRREELEEGELGMEVDVEVDVDVEVEEDGNMEEGREALAPTLAVGIQRPKSAMEISSSRDDAFSSLDSNQAGCSKEVEGGEQEPQQQLEEKISRWRSETQPHKQTDVEQGNRGGEVEEDEDEDATMMMIKSGPPCQYEALTPVMLDGRGGGEMSTKTIQNGQKNEEKEKEKQQKEYVEIVIDDSEEEEEMGERRGGEENMNAEEGGGGEEANAETMPCLLPAEGGAADGQEEEGQTDGQQEEEEEEQEEEQEEAEVQVHSSPATTKEAAQQKGADEPMGNDTERNAEMEQNGQQYLVAPPAYGANANGHAKTLMLNKSDNLVQYAPAHPSANQIQSNPQLGSQCFILKRGGQGQGEQGQHELQQIQCPLHPQQQHQQQQQNQQGASTSSSASSSVAGTNGRSIQQPNLGAALHSNGGAPLANNSPPPPPSSQESVGGAPNGPPIHPPFLLAELLDQLRECAERFRMQMQHNGGGAIVSIWRMERKNGVAQCSTDMLVFEDKLTVIKVQEMRKFEEQRERGRLVKQWIGMEQFWMKADAQQFMMAVRGKCDQFLCEQHKWD